MPTLKLELVDQDGRAICRGQAFVWLIDSAAGAIGSRESSQPSAVPTPSRADRAGPRRSAGPC